MFKISRLNPKDTILDEIHSIQDKLFNEEKDLTWEEKRILFDKSKERFEKNLGCKLRVLSLDEIPIMKKP